MNVIAGSWLIASVFMVLMTVMSSTIFAVYGSSSLTQVPACPCCANVNADFATGSVRLPHRLRDALPLANGVGNLRALELRETRLVVERLELRRPAGLVQEDDALGLWREVGQRAQPTCLRIARVLEGGESVSPAPAAQQLRRQQRPERRGPDAAGGQSRTAAGG